MSVRQNVVIRSARIVVKGYIRLQLCLEEEFQKCGGKNPPSFWKEWRVTHEAEIFKKAELLNRGDRKFVIPASLVIGSDQVSDVRIDWEKNFRLRRKLLALWVMET